MFFLYFDKLFAMTYVDLYRIVFRENSLRSCISQYTHVTILKRRSTFNKMIYQKWNFERRPNLTHTIYSSLLSLKLNKCNACAHLSGYPYEVFWLTIFLVISFTTIDRVTVEYLYYFWLRRFCCRMIFLKLTDLRV